jgi:hypothetical protein
MGVGVVGVAVLWDGGVRSIVSGGLDELDETDGPEDFSLLL